MRVDQILNDTLRSLLGSNKNAYLLGEDIADPYGGAFKVTKGLSTAFPDQVIPTPISEAAIIGMAGGMALRGMRPIVEIMFGDFLTLGFDQIVNHIAKFSSMYAAKVKVPLVIRTPMGGGRGYGPTHSQNLEKHFLGIPGLKVVAPSILHNPGELLQKAFEDTLPVLFIEHKLLYHCIPIVDSDREKGLYYSRSKTNTRYPTAQLCNYSSGRPDVVIITYGGSTVMLEDLLVSMAEDEFRIACCVPSEISRPDYAGLANDVLAAKAGFIVWEEGAKGFDWGSEICAMIQAELGPRMPPCIRIASIPTAIPAAGPLEQLVLPGLDDVRAAVYSLVEQSLG